MSIGYVDGGDAVVGTALGFCNNEVTNEDIGFQRP
jgi:hypothetical protein